MRSEIDRTGATEVGRVDIYQACGARWDKRKTTVYIFIMNNGQKQWTETKQDWPAGVEELEGALPVARWLGVFLTAHCIERGACAALLAWEALVVLSSGSSKRKVSWSTSSLWLLLLSESLESLDWESSSEKKAGTLLAPLETRRDNRKRQNI